METSSVFQSLFSLGLVVASIFLVAWLLRRVQNLRPRGAAALRIHGGLSVGGRERVMWIEAGGQHLLIGVAPGRVNTLHVFAEAPIETEIAAVSTAVLAPKFGDLLKRALGKESA